MLHSSTVIRELLQSCYTGILQFSTKEIVNYLTAASYLQMEHVVEKCRVALSQYLQSKSSSAGVRHIQSSTFRINAVFLFACDSFGFPFLLFLSSLVQSVKTEGSQAMASIVSGSTHSLGDMSPPSERASSLQPHSSEEELQVSGVEHAGVQHRDEADLSIARVNIC